MIDDDPVLLRALAKARLKEADTLDDPTAKIRKKKIAGQLRREATAMERRADRLERKAKQAKDPARIWKKLTSRIKPARRLDYFYMLSWCAQPKGIYPNCAKHRGMLNRLRAEQLVKTVHGYALLTELGRRAVPAPQEEARDPRGSARGGTVLMAGGGTGNPSRFVCSACRRSRLWRERRGSVIDVELTGRTRPNRSHGRGARVAASEYEYRCPCGHQGWSNHVQLAHKAGRDRSWVAPASASDRVAASLSLAEAWEELSIAQQHDMLLAWRADRNGASRALRTGRALVRRGLVVRTPPDPGAAHRDDRKGTHALTERGRALAEHGASL